MNELIRRLIPDKLYLQILFKRYLGKRLNLGNPVTYNEKLQWIKLYDHREIYTKLADKYEVKKYVEEKIGKEYIIPFIGERLSVWDKVEDIPFEKLPDQFVLKTTHDSGGIVICKDKSKFDVESAKLFLKGHLEKNYYYAGREWPYKHIKPRIIGEQYLEDKRDGELRDYKFFVFNGIVRAMFIATDRGKDTETCFDFYDLEFKHLELKHGHPNAEKEIKKPEKWEEMLRLSEILGEGIPHVRVDFYQCNGKIYFGELTFFHHGGFMPFEPPEWDEIFGEWFDLPKKQCK